MKSLNTILALSLFACTLPSEAQIALSESSLSPSVQKKIAATTVMMESPAGWCTAVPVSPDGYLLTALHCVRDCLKSKGAAEEGVAGSYGLTDLFLVTRPTNVHVVCDDQTIPALGAKSVTVVATGKTLSVFDAEFFNDFSPFHQELKVRGLTSRANDFALLKIETQKKLACLPILPHAIQAGAKIWAAGFPIPSVEGEKPVLQVSPGQVYESAKMSQHYKSEPEQNRSYIESLYSDSAVLYSNAVSQWGQSGGPIVSADGAVVGVVSGYTVTKARNTEIHELVGARASWFAQQIPFEVVRSSSQCR